MFCYFTSSLNIVSHKANLLKRAYYYKQVSGKIYYMTSAAFHTMRRPIPPLSSFFLHNRNHISITSLFFFLYFQVFSSHSQLNQFQSKLFIFRAHLSKTKLALVKVEKTKKTLCQKISRYIHYSMRIIFPCRQYIQHYTNGA